MTNTSALIIVCTLVVSFVAKLTLSKLSKNFQNNLVVGDYVFIKKNKAGRIANITDQVELVMDDGSHLTVEKWEISRELTMAFQKKQKGNVKHN